jgi:hypothetical protein
VAVGVEYFIHVYYANCTPFRAVNAGLVGFNGCGTLCNARRSHCVCMVGLRILVLTWNMPVLPSLYWMKSIDNECLQIFGVYALTVGVWGAPAGGSLMQNDANCGRFTVNNTKKAVPVYPRPAKMPPVTTGRCIDLKLIETYYTA